MKKRVLQFIGSFHSGGSERQAVALTRLLASERSCDVFVATLNNDGVLRPEIENLGLPEIEEYRLTSFFNANFVQQTRRCAAFLRDTNIDVVHTHDFYTNVFGMAAATLAGVNLRIASKRETGGMKTKAQEFVERVAFSRAHAITANSVAARDYIAGRGVPARKIKVIYNGLDLTRFETGMQDACAPVAALRAAPGSKLVTIVANLRHSVKNIPMLLRAAKKVGAITKDAHFVVAGEGELENELKTLAAELGVAENTHFIGRCDDVPALLAASDICVLTSTNEGFSNSILEYMAAEKPVVATRVGGAAEAIIDGETGYLVNSDDDSALADRLIELLGDDRKATAFGKHGKRVASDKFSHDVQLKKILELYGL